MNDDVLSMVKYDSGMEFKRSDFLLLMGPIVYVFFDGDNPLYVGMSVKGIGRPADPGHHAMKNKHFTSVKMWACKGASAAKRLEKHLIKTMLPPLNVAHRMMSDAERIAKAMGTSKYTTRKLQAIHIERARRKREARSA
jgi:hypothetical protein